MRNLEIPTYRFEGKQVYFQGRLLRGAQAETFEILLGIYARDSKSVFFGPFRASKIDPASVRVLNGYFAVDNKQAFFAHSPIKEADPQSFRVLDSGMWHTGSSGFAGAFLGGGFVADHKSVWFCSGSGVYRIKNADPGTFVSLGNRFGFDREGVYFERSSIPGADRATWRIWRGMHSVDKNNVFFTNKKVAGVDRASITLLEHSDCFMDRHRLYVGERSVTPEEYFKLLKYTEDHCAMEREWISNGKIFDRALDEHPHSV